MKNNWNTAIITGAGSGIGLFMAKTLLANGSKVAVLDLKFSDEVREELTELGGSNVVFHDVNIADAAGVEEVVIESVAKIGAPDIAINCAGINVAKPFTEITAEEYSLVIDINLKGSRNFAASVIPVMKSGGQLALMASLGGLIANYTYGAYSSSKFGVVGLANVLRTECKPKGIDVSMICPPEIATPMVVEEHANIDPVALELKMMAGALELPEACAEIFQQLEKRRFVVMPGFRARLVWRLSRLFPGIFIWSTDRAMKRSYLAT